MKVTVGIIALNEEKYLGGLLESLIQQTYPKDHTQIVLVDGGSTDNTKQIMQQFANDNNEYWSIKVLDNPKRIQPAGLNVVIDNADGDVIIRLDAHSLAPNDFVENNVKCIQSGEDVCGGMVKKIVQSKKTIPILLDLAENSMFGGGIASYRRETKKEYVNSIAQGCYKKEVFDKVGHFDERLPRAEDNDIHYRIRQAGYKVCKSSDIFTEYITRPSLKGMLKQKYGNGKWIGVASAIKTPKMFSLYHFIPMLFVLGVIVATALLVPAIALWSSVWWLALPFFVGVGAYVLLDLLLSLKASIDGKQPLGLVVLPWLFPMLHIAYGWGTIVGLVTAKKYK